MRYTKFPQAVAGRTVERIFNVIVRVGQEPEQRHDLELF